MMYLDVSVDAQLIIVCEAEVGSLREWDERTDILHIVDCRELSIDENVKLAYQVAKV